MANIVLKVENLSKKYIIGHKSNARYTALREVITHGAMDIGKRIASFCSDRLGTVHNSTTEDFFALKDVSFEVKQGDRIGIIGRNGAGKSTLLKLLSRITEPTTGRISIKGRVASLLEVGTGFHPELTGRENIYLNGAILGMARTEIKRKFDEIVSFAEVERFLDTPVKRYSSGMYVRLAFAVAAHLEPEILVVDEVLAVGDAQFQKKCLGKMKEVGNEGRTVLFVSHNMLAIKQLCDKTLILKEGRVEFLGPTENGIPLYLQSGMCGLKEKTWDKARAPGDNVVKIYKVFSHAEDRVPCDTFDITKKIGITFEYEVLEGGYTFTHGMNVFNEEGLNIFDSHDVVSRTRYSPCEKGVYTSTVWIPGNIMSEGIFSISAAIFKPTPFVLHAHAVDAVSFRVIDSIRGDSARGDYSGGFPGIVRPLLNWETSKTG